MLSISPSPKCCGLVNPQPNDKNSDKSNMKVADNKINVT